MEQGNGLGRGRGLSTRGSWGGTGGGGRGISGGCGKSHRGGRGAAFQHKSHTEKKFKPLLSGLNISGIFDRFAKSSYNSSLFFIRFLPRLISTFNTILSSI